MNCKHLPNTLLLMAILGMATTIANGQTGVSIRPKVYLQGALHGLLPTATLMRDNLRTKGYIPLTEPYTSMINYQYTGGGGGETIVDTTVLQVTGANAIVDWVIVELRSTTMLDQAIASRAALLQRDGDVVGVDGTSPVHFASQTPGSYYIVVTHRNHLGVMTKNPVQLSETPIVVDFTNDDITPTNNACMVKIGNKKALRGGDLNKDKRFVFAGPGNDVFKLFSTVLSDQDNTGPMAFFVSSGYKNADANMDGKTIFQGPGSDREIMFQFVITAGINPEYNYVIVECVP